MRLNQLIFFFFFSCFLYSQNQISSKSDEVKIYSLNLDDRKLTETLPFDRSFPLDIISKDNKLNDTLFLFRVFFKRKKDEISRNYESFEKDKEPKARPLTLIHIKDSLYRTLVPPLNPDKIYEFMFRVKFSDEKLNDLLSAYSFIGNNDVKAKTIYNSKIKNIEKAIKNVPNLNNITTGVMDKTFNDFQTDIVPQFKSVFRDLSTDLADNIKGNVSHVGLPDLKLISKSFKEKEIENELNLFYDFLLSKASLQDLLKGYVGLGEIEKLKKHELGKRMTALKLVVKKLKQLNSQLADLILVSDVEIPFRDRVQEYIKVAAENVVELKNSSQKLRKIVDVEYAHARTFSAETGGNGLKVKAGRTIVSDFGLVSFFPKNNQGEFKLLARPYTGINIYFGGGIDRDLKIRELEQRKFWNMVSLSIGVTIGGISEENFTDLFNGLSPTIGANVRIAPRIRLGVGTLILRENNINPTISLQPIEFSPYLNVSFDLELQQYLGQLITTVFK